MKLFVEGGGDTKGLRTKCREGFTSFLSKAGVKIKPRIVACGSRKNAFDSYCTAKENGDPAMLLVDAEAAISIDCQIGALSEWLPWRHLKDRKGDNWDKPTGSSDRDCHLMTQLMESWFLADRRALAAYFGPNFEIKKLPSETRNIETIEKSDVYFALKDATKKCLTKGEYGKGAHSFDILKSIDPSLVAGASPWARRFLDSLK